jgi:hypothetical protein
MINQLRTVKDYVLHFLKTKPDLRDNDLRLIANIWAGQLGGSTALTNISALEFVKLFAEDRLYSPESIRRARQKIQEDYPDLRGTTYQARHEHSKEVRYQIKNL